MLQQFDFKPNEKQLYVVRDKKKQEILSHDGVSFLYKAEYDTEDIEIQNRERRKLIGAGWSESRELKEEFEIPQDIYYSHPDCVEYARTRNRAVMRRFLQKHPWYRSSTGSY